MITDMTPEQHARYLKLWHCAWDRDRTANPAQLYRVVAVLANDAGVITAPTCGICDSDKTVISCPGCQLLVCSVCWSVHIENDPRCTPERIATIHEEHRLHVKALHAFTQEVKGRSACQCAACMKGMPVPTISWQP